jgi:hypothetical protein
MPLDFDESAIRRRGAVTSGNDSSKIVRCTACGRQSLYNDEILQLYLDPDELSASVLHAEGGQMPPCRDCEKTNWQGV